MGGLEALKGYVFTLDMFRGLMFVFDHDFAGLEAVEKMSKLGYRPEQHCFTLDPKQHVGALARKQVVIEDLLSRDIQMRFFNQGHGWCTIDYEDGTMIRFQWGHQSKALLRDFVCKNGKWADMKEVARILNRARIAFGLPTFSKIFDDNSSDG